MDPYLHEDGIARLRAERSPLTAELRALGFTRILVPTGDTNRTLRLVVTPDERVDIADLAEADEIASAVAGEDVEIISVRTHLGARLSVQAVEL